MSRPRNTNGVIVEEQPAEFIGLANSRTRGIVEMYGANIMHPMVSIQMLASSCYLQGIRDANEAIEHAKHRDQLKLVSNEGKPVAFTCGNLSLSSV